ncbi:hypothetical protein [Streptomyces sp. MBT70]|uniref:hypothetical protein n=1 Tax=Streptomyces sp. MBT70 TaxID=1488400 RepID=UPI001F376046|nr:hypothetical protein [Streptomyces sp. MBT70]
MPGEFGLGRSEDVVELGGTLPPPAAGTTMPRSVMEGQHSADGVSRESLVGSARSWDILLLPLPADVTSIDDLPTAHEPPPIGSRSSVHRALRSAAGEVDLTDPTWGELLGPTWVIELGIGEHGPVESVMLHVRGGEDDVLPVVFRISRALGCHPFGCSNGELLADDAQAGWNAFQSFRDRTIASDSLGEP